MSLSLSLTGYDQGTQSFSSVYLYMYLSNLSVYELKCVYIYLIELSHHDANKSHASWSQLLWLVFKWV